MDPASDLSLAFTLPLRNQPGLEDLIRRLHDPADSFYGRYLTPTEFTSRFGPTQADYDLLVAYARSIGLTVTGTHPNRLILNVTGPVAAVEAAFNLHILRFQAPDGREFFGPDQDPIMPDFVASRLGGVVGLDNAAVWHSHAIADPADQRASAAPHQIGSGPNGGLTPNDIRTAYNLTGVSAAGTGQVLGLFELDGYLPTDVAAYVSYFGLPSVPLQNVLVDGFSGNAGTGAREVTLDIELQIALAPGATKIMVYEGPNTSTGIIDTYSRIANDNLAKQISTSWGLSEDQAPSSVRNSENTVFMQMAVQGQSIYAAAGDSGAYDNGSTLSVDDPASQPYVVGVGGTQLFVDIGGTYNHETTWNLGTAIAGAGGGGISTIWPIPIWQAGAATQYLSQSGFGSATMRNVPDVALNADPNGGYAIYYAGAWYTYGGTSCAAPLWAAFTALVNQQRAANGGGALGFANPALYQLAQGANYASDFHDIADGSTNLVYPAVASYDDATGWGSFNGTDLWIDLSSYGLPTPPAPANLTATAGNLRVNLNWSPSPGAASYTVYRGTSSGGETSYASGIRTNSYQDGSVAYATAYYYKVTATNNTGTSGFSNEASITLMPLAITGLTPNITIPAAVGTPITWTAAVTGGAPPLQFRFYVWFNNIWTMVQDYSTANTCTWTPTQAGQYNFAVWARNSGSAAAYDAYRLYGYFNITPQSVTISPSPGVPQPLGARITWTAIATGGIAPLQYRFYVWFNNIWTMVQDYSTANTCAWTPTQTGQYNFAVWVRNSGSTAAYDAYQFYGYFNITAPTPLSVTIGGSPAPPQLVGTPITWTATATGGVAPLQYRFYVWFNNVWTMVQDYSTVNTYTWTPTQAGQYNVAVWVRNAGSTAAYDAYKFTGNFNITPQSVSISPSPALPQRINTAITWSATATGGVAPLQYRFYVWFGGAWTMVQDYTTSNTFIWTPTVAGQYNFAVWVRNAGSTAPFDTYVFSGYFNISP